MLAGFAMNCRYQTKIWYLYCRPSKIVGRAQSIMVEAKYLSSLSHLAMLLWACGLFDTFCWWQEEDVPLTNCLSCIFCRSRFICTMFDGPSFELALGMPSLKARPNSFIGGPLLIWRIVHTILYHRPNTKWSAVLWMKILHRLFNSIVTSLHTFASQVLSQPQALSMTVHALFSTSVSHPSTAPSQGMAIP